MRVGDGFYTASPVFERRNYDCAHPSCREIFHHVIVDWWVGIGASCVCGWVPAA